MSQDQDNTRKLVRHQTEQGGAGVTRASDPEALHKWVKKSELPSVVLALEAALRLARGMVATARLIGQARSLL